MPSPFRDEIKNLWENAAHPLAALWEWAKDPDDPARRAERWDALADWAGSHKRQQDHDSDEWKSWRKRQRVYRKRARVNENGEDPETPGIEDGGWHPDARRAGVVNGIGALDPNPCLVWHTTEGYGLPAYSGSNPHFTLDPKTGVLYQHQSVREGARALRNLPGGVETNRGAIQVELIGFASQSHTWSEEAYDHIADLARWIEEHCGVLRECDVRFDVPAGATPHMTAAQWNAYRGHCGHRHVPENDHWDPGNLQIAKVLDK